MSVHDASEGRVASATRFSTLSTIDGYEVIAVDTGRPVAYRETLASANGVASALNQVAYDSRQLSRVLARMVK